MLAYIYISIIQPKIDYAITLWGYTCQQNLHKIQRLQNRAARIVSGNYDYVINTRGIELVKSLQWMNVHQRRDYFMSILKACAQRFRYALFALIHTQTYFEYHTLTLRLASLVKKAVIYAYWTKELFDICRENVSHMATLPSVARHVIHADNLRPRH